jgi:hypothetical protein
MGPRVRGDDGLETVDLPTASDNARLVPPKIDL